MMNDIQELQQIFPNWSEQKLISVYSRNGNSLERTVEAIFGEEAQGNEQRNSRSGSIDSERVDANFTDDDNYRGIEIILPEDFLRPPGWRNKFLGERDEQLALMLQNEIYAADTREMMLMQNSVNRASRRHPAHGNTAANGNPTPVRGQDDIMPDLGILKTINVVSDIAKRNFDALSKMASQQISESTAPPERGTRTETNPLVQQGSEDEEDEVINFEESYGGRGGPGNRHILDQPVDRQSAGTSTSFSSKKEK